MTFKDDRHEFTISRIGHHIEVQRSDGYLPDPIESRRIICSFIEQVEDLTAINESHDMDDDLVPRTEHPANEYPNRHRCHDVCMCREVALLSRDVIDLARAVADLRKIVL